MEASRPPRPLPAPSPLPPTSPPLPPKLGTKPGSPAPQTSVEAPSQEAARDVEAVGDWPVRLLAIAPYALPALDAIYLFGASFAVQHAPDLYSAGIAFSAQVPRDFWDLMVGVQPLVLFGMPVIAVRRRLPTLLRFNLNQAFVLDLMAHSAHLAATTAGWLSSRARGEDMLYVPVAAEPKVVPAGDVLLVIVALCLVYSVASTLLGEVPRRLPAISMEADRSLGSLQRELGNERSEEQDQGDRTGR